LENTTLSANLCTQLYLFTKRVIALVKTYLQIIWGARGCAVVEALRYKLKDARSIPDGVTGFFH
jgi:hypothetical protein